MRSTPRRTLALAVPFCLLAAAALAAPPAKKAAKPATYAKLPSEIPETLVPVTDAFDYVERRVEIPMRDGVKLHTVILIPRAVTKEHPAGILLTRTPYDADGMTTQKSSAWLRSRLEGWDNEAEIVVEGGYIRVVQDVRGKYGSEGDYVLTRPLAGPQNPTPVDHATDTFDTIDWLVKNVPESNGRVAILGHSYDGFLPLMATVDPHPALKVAVAMNPMVDGWMGDDWLHHGAFRQQMLPFLYEIEGGRSNGPDWWTTHHDDYEAYLAAGSAGAMAASHGMEQTGFWRKILAHPAYDAFWQDQAVDRILAARPLTVPLMLVDSLFDQEDIYGAPAVYRALEPKDVRNDMVYLVLGPWRHSQSVGDGSTTGPLRWGSDTALAFRREVLRPFLDRYLKDAPRSADAPPATTIAPVTAFETGTNTWRRLEQWPSACARGCAPTPTPLYVAAGGRLSFDPPAGDAAGFDEYVSDPAKPVPYRPRPVGPASGEGWRDWLLLDQRFVSSRPDVLSWTSDVLAAPVRVAGQPFANLVASTTGSDADWVVKLVDVYPPEVPQQPELGGYELAIAADIFRGRYRASFSEPQPIAPGEPLLYRFALPTVNHVFLPGHRIQVQVQSSWFPLYDRNPQSFVPSIFEAKPADYVKATQRIWHDPAAADRRTFVELPLVDAP